MFEVIFLLFSWLPSPLDALAFGAIALILVVAIVRLLVALWELLPFN